LTPQGSKCWFFFIFVHFVNSISKLSFPLFFRFRLETLRSGRCFFLFFFVFVHFVDSISKVFFLHSLGFGWNETTPYKKKKKNSEVQSRSSRRLPTKKEKEIQSKVEVETNLQKKKVQSRS